MTVQFIRKASLVVVTGERGLDLSDMKFRFNVRQADARTPNTAVIRIWNLSDATSRKVQDEYSRVILQAGYNGQDHYGVIFDGTIKQVRRGKESAVNTFTDIYAADGDILYNQTIVKMSLDKSATSMTDRFQALVGVASRSGVNVRYSPGVSIGPALPRGKVLYGMWRDQMDTLAGTQGWSWSVQDGQLVFTPLTGYVPGTAVVLTSQTGLIGMPEQTQDGIKARCLLNPKIKVGSLVQIDNKSIIPAAVDLEYTAVQALPRIADDGFYKAIVVEHDGDTRENDWYTDIICFVVDQTAPAGASVKAYG